MNVGDFLDVVDSGSINLNGVDVNEKSCNEQMTALQWVTKTPAKPGGGYSAREETLALLRCSAPIEDGCVSGVTSGRLSCLEHFFCCRPSHLACIRLTVRCGSVRFWRCGLVRSGSLVPAGRVERVWVRARRARWGFLFFLFPRIPRNY